MGDINSTPGFGPAGFDRGDALPCGLEPDRSKDANEPEACPTCGSKDRDTTVTDDGITTDPRVDHSPGVCRDSWHGEVSR